MLLLSLSLVLYCHQHCIVVTGVCKINGVVVVVVVVVVVAVVVEQTMESQQITTITTPAVSLSVSLSSP